MAFYVKTIESYLERFRQLLANEAWKRRVGFASGLVRVPENDEHDG